LVPRIDPGESPRGIAAQHCGPLKIECMAEQPVPLPSLEAPSCAPSRAARDARLRKHADYQRVYKASRKHFSPSMTYFYALRAPVVAAARSSDAGPRVGLTAGKALGNAVERNRIKRRMREAVRKNIGKLAADVDVILHPRKSAIAMEWAKLEAEVGRIFTTVQSALDRESSKKS